MILDGGYIRHGEVLAQRPLSLQRHIHYRSILYCLQRYDIHIHAKPRHSRIEYCQSRWFIIFLAPISKVSAVKIEMDSASENKRLSSRSARSSSQFIDEMDILLLTIDCCWIYGGILQLVRRIGMFRSTKICFVPRQAAPSYTKHEAQNLLPPALSATSSHLASGLHR